MNDSKDILKRLYTDDPYFYAAVLKIRNKSGEIVPFYLNDAQRIVQKAADKMLAEKGLVRIIIVKYRQGGLSTFVEGRIYKKTSMSYGKKAIILAHEADAANNLFEMSKRFYNLSPDELKPALKACNGKILEFEELGSSYKVATANNKNAGRSDTVQYLHGSEVAFWADGEEIMKGLAQTVPEEKGTEVYLESTCNGFNFFYRMVKMALAGLSQYRVVFIPWFLEKGYQSEVPEDFKLSDDEIEYMDMFNLNLNQMAWRRNKINTDFSGNVDHFNQEYPATLDMAFVKENHYSLIDTVAVQKARDKDPRYLEKTGAHVVGVDVARYGDDRTVFIHRQGRVAWGKESHNKINSMEIAGKIVNMLNNDPTIAMVFIDITGGLGAGTYDRVVELGYGDKVTAVSFSSKANDDRKYFNKRSEMWGELKEWIEDDVTPSIPDDDSLHGDLTAPSYTYTSNGQIKLDPKEKIKKETGVSPDDGDALALTFAEKININNNYPSPTRGYGNNSLDYMAA